MPAERPFLTGLACTSATELPGGPLAKLLVSRPTEALCCNTRSSERYLSLSLPVALNLQTVLVARPAAQGAAQGLFLFSGPRLLHFHTLFGKCNIDLTLHWYKPSKGAKQQGHDTAAGEAVQTAYDGTMLSRSALTPCSSLCMRPGIYNRKSTA